MVRGVVHLSDSFFSANFFFVPQSYGFRNDLVGFFVAIYPVYFGSVVLKQTKSIYCHENAENRVLWYNFPNSSFICVLFVFHWHFDGKECEQHTV